MNVVFPGLRTGPGGLYGLALLLMVVLWAGLWKQLSVEWTINAQYSYGWGVPFLGLYLVWQRWRDRPGRTASALPRPVLLVALLAATLLPIRLLQEANPDWRLVSWAYGLVVVAMTLCSLDWACGRRWVSHFWVAVAFVLIAVPWPTPAENLLVQTLMRAVAALTVEFVNWCGTPAVRAGNLIYVANGVVGIDEACSGVRSFQATLMGAVFLGELYRFRLARRWQLIGLGVALAVALNSVRALVLTWLTARYGMDTMSFWHDPAGYTVMLAAFAGLWTVAARLKQPAVARAPGADSAVPARAAAASPGQPVPGPKPLRFGWVGVLAVWLVAVEFLTEGWYRRHEASLQPRVSWSLAWPETAPGFRPEKIEEDLRRILRFSEGKAAAWQRNRREEWLVYWFRWAPGRAAAQSARLHSPELCLSASGLKLVSEFGVRTVLVRGLSLPFRTYLFEFRGHPWVVFYCLWEDRRWKTGPAATEDLLSRRSRLRAVIEGERHLGQLVLEVAIAGQRDVPRAEKELEAFLQEALVVEAEQGQ